MTGDGGHGHGHGHHGGFAHAAGGYTAGYIVKRNDQEKKAEPSNAEGLSKYYDGVDGGDPFALDEFPFTKTEVADYGSAS